MKIISMGYTSYLRYNLSFWQFFLHKIWHLGHSLRLCVNFLVVWAPLVQSPALLLSWGIYNKLLRTPLSFAFSGSQHRSFSRFCGGTLSTCFSLSLKNFIHMCNVFWSSPPLPPFTFPPASSLLTLWPLVLPHVTGFFKNPPSPLSVTCTCHLLEHG